MLSDLEEKKQPFMQNRELSWLKFNERVIEEAADQEVPLLERLKYISIFTSNLDEFFMIRVGSLQDIESLDPNFEDSKSGMTAKEQLEAIYKAVRPLYQKKDQLFNMLTKQLRHNGVVSYEWHELVDSDQKFVKDYYKSMIKPLLSPQVVDAHRPFPHIHNKGLYIFMLLKSKEEHQLGILPVPVNLPEYISLPGRQHHFILTEKVIYAFCEEVFGKLGVVEKACLSITRNGDINAEDESFDITDDYRNRMKKLLKKRNKMSVVRLESNHELSDQLRQELCHHFKLKHHQLYTTSAPLKMAYVFDLLNRVDVSQMKDLVFPPYRAVLTDQLDSSRSLMQQIRQKDVLVHHPYESMGTFLQLIKEASNNDQVISIKITIYRLAKKAKLVDYLCAAAENGKEVTVIVELRARFDEQNNIDWSEKLEDSGCRVIYGFEAYKVHSKLCLITYKDRNTFHYITQVGTGNYNEKTSEVYTDLSLMTANGDIGKDAEVFFNNMSLGNLNGEYNQLLVAPNRFKQSLLALMDQEIIKGNQGRILMKLNSMTDIDIISKLSEASIAGVEVKLVIRGICCLLPEVSGKTEKISVISIVGRYLEHSRIYAFGKEGSQSLYIASADLMTRNTERRVEVGCPILDPDIQQKINRIFEAYFYDNVKARQLCSDGSYTPIACKRIALNSQVYFCDAYTHRESPKKHNKQSVSEKVVAFIKSWVR